MILIIFVPRFSLNSISYILSSEFFCFCLFFTLFQGATQVLGIFYHGSIFFQLRFLLNRNFLYLSSWRCSWGKCRFNCLKFMPYVLFSEIERWVEYPTRKRCLSNYFSGLSSPLFSLILPTTWDTALVLKHCCYLETVVAIAWSKERRMEWDAGRIGLEATTVLHSSHC